MSRHRKKLKRTPAMAQPPRPTTDTPLLGVTKAEIRRLLASKSELEDTLPQQTDGSADVADDPWLRDYLLRAYCINHNVDFERLPRERLTITDAKNLLIKQVELGTLLAELETRSTPPPQQADESA